MRILGIDLGSREVKIVLMENKEIIYKKRISTMSFYRDYCNYDKKIVVDLDKFNLGRIDRYISTGYGRNNTDLKKFKAINEIKAHVYGGIFQTALENFILLDVGGQDVKIARVETGLIKDLELNNKCAASCGRYLENMAQVLEVELDDLFTKYKDPVELNSTCAVFSESELIGKIAEGIETDRLSASVNYALYRRLKPLLMKFYGEQLIITGGVARNKALAKYLQEDYKDIISVDAPQYNGAIGCCYYGMKVG